MNEKLRAKEIAQEFEEEYTKTLKQLKSTYPRVSRIKKDDNLSENVFNIVIHTVLINMLKQLQVDSTQLSFNKFHAKYTPTLPILYRWDFTTEEFKQIIDNSYLTDRDKDIAYKFFIEKKNASNVFDEMLDINNKKTVDNNLSPINDILLHRACEFNKDKN